VYLASHPCGRCEGDDKKALGVVNWWLSDPDNVTVTWESFEPETPPVHFRFAITDAPPPIGCGLGSTSCTSWSTQVVPEKPPGGGLITRKDEGGWCIPRPNDFSPTRPDRFTHVISKATGELTTSLAEG